MKEATCLYRPGTEFSYEGASYDMIIVDACDVPEYTSQGWSLTATQKPVDDSAPPTREELEQEATELGIAFGVDTPDSALLARITEILEGG